MIFNRVHIHKKQYKHNMGNKHDSPGLKAAIMTSVHPVLLLVVAKVNLAFRVYPKKFVYIISCATTIQTHTSQEKHDLQDPESCLRAHLIYLWVCVSILMCFVVSSI